MRVYFYVIAGLSSALIGWNIGQVFLGDWPIFKGLPEIALFPAVATALAIGLVANEIFVSNPTRPKLNFRILPVSLLLAAGLGLLVGLIAGVVVQILAIPEINRTPAWFSRLLGWLLIGIAVGLAEGLTWRWRSVEAGDRKRYKQRIRTSVIGGCIGSAVAALIFELLRSNGIDFRDFKQLEDPIGFALLGIVLGLTFSITNSPSYMAALRAGAGFEFREFDDPILGLEPAATEYPFIQKRNLSFVSDSELHQIEEGLSIRLPGTGKLHIGSAPKNSDIYLPGVPLHVADIILTKRTAVLQPNALYFQTIEINGEPLDRRKNILLKHNSLLTFYTVNHDAPYSKKYYRLVYYNRFLDPQA